MYGKRCKNDIKENKLNIHKFNLKNIEVLCINADSGKMAGRYRCVHCGAQAENLYNSYGPTVLKLNRCIQCRCHVDKYIEYDPVIIIIDLILISREAQRHVIYNTGFDSYWKIFVVLTMLETYGVWHHNSFLTMGIETMCYSQSIGLTDHLNSLMIFSDTIETNCRFWTDRVQMDDVDIFIWEKNFYIHFISVVTGVIAFILCLYFLMRLYSMGWPQNKVSVVRTVKAFTLAYVSIVFTAPVLVWGTPPEGAAPALADHTLHHVLAFAYSALVFFNVFTVVFAGSPALVASALAMGFVIKLSITFFIRPILHHMIT